MTTTTFNELGLIRIDDLADILKISSNTIRTWKQRENIPPKCFLKVAGTVFVKVNEIKQWIEQA